MTASAERISHKPRAEARGLTVLHIVAVIAAAVAIPFVPGFDTLRLAPFLILLGLVVAGELSSAGEGMTVSGGFLGLVMAEVEPKSFLAWERPDDRPHVRQAGAPAHPGLGVLAGPDGEQFPRIRLDPLEMRG